MTKISNQEDVKIIIRPHPSDPLDKYENLQKKYQNTHIDNTISIVESFNKTNYVVGVESAALHLAQYCGKKTFSSMPPWGRKIRIPMNNIKLISDIN